MKQARHVPAVAQGLQSFAGVTLVDEDVDVDMWRYTATDRTSRVSANLSRKIWLLGEEVTWCMRMHYVTVAQ